jgi:hypothetical protein
VRKSAVNVEIGLLSRKAGKGKEDKILVKLVFTKWCWHFWMANDISKRRFTLLCEA